MWDETEGIIPTWYFNKRMVADRPMPEGSSSQIQLHSSEADQSWQSRSRHQEGSSDSETEWQSKSRRKDTDTLLYLDQSRRALYERVEASVSFGFAAIQRAVLDMQLQLQINLCQLMDQQENILQTQSPSPDAIAEFEENVKKIDRSLESFTAYADNLSHIKLTLARAAAFVSPEGNLAQLVTKAPQKEQQILRTHSPRAIVGRENDPKKFVPSSFKLTPHTEKVKFEAELAKSEPVVQQHRAPNDTGFSRSCFVTNLPFKASTRTLRQLFSRYGTVLNTHVVKEKDGHPKGYGFVDFLSPAEAQAAINALDGFPLGGKKLKVEFCRVK